MFKIVLLLPWVCCFCLSILRFRDSGEVFRAGLICGFIILFFVILLGGVVGPELSILWEISVGGYDKIGPFVFAIDYVSYFFFLLVSFLTLICLLVSWRSITTFVREFVICLFVVEGLLFGAFSCFDLLLFFVFFEGVLIPMFLIIGVWGSREEKVRAVFYFFFFTFFGSVFLLVGIFWIYSVVGSLDYFYLESWGLGFNEQCILFLLFFLCFAVKIPLFPFHIWLPQAHVEAPVAGSVLLAGVLLKLGGYGILRFLLKLFPLASLYFSPALLVLGLLGVLWGGFITCRQVDFKRLVAYSSVAHMGVVVISLFSFSLWGTVGGFYLMLAHGLVSPALFIAVTVLYDRHKTRLIKYYRGVGVQMPLFSVLFLLLLLANFGLPLSCGFIGEFVCLFAAFSYSAIVGILALWGGVLSVVYSLFLYNRIVCGRCSFYLMGGRDLGRREMYILGVFVFLIYLLGIFPFFILDSFVEYD